LIYTIALAFLVLSAAVRPLATSFARFANPIEIALTALAAIAYYGFVRFRSPAGRYALPLAATFAVGAFGPLAGIAGALVLDALVTLFRPPLRPSEKLSPLETSAAVAAILASYAGFALVTGALSDVARFGFALVASLAASFFADFLYERIAGEKPSEAGTVVASGVYPVLLGAACALGMALATVGKAHSLATLLALAVSYVVVEKGYVRLKVPNAESLIYGIAAGAEDVSYEARDLAARVSHLVTALAIRMGLSDEEVRNAALVPRLVTLVWLRFGKTLFRRPDALSMDEQVSLATAIAETAAFLEEAGISPSVVAAIRSAYEHFDGTGIPGEKAGSAIPLLSRLHAVCEEYDRLTSWRPAEETLSDEAALERIRERAGTWFDPEVVAAFDAFIRGETPGEATGELEDAGGEEPAEAAEAAETADRGEGFQEAAKAVEAAGQDAESQQAASAPLSEPTPLADEVEEERGEQSSAPETDAAEQIGRPDSLDETSPALPLFGAPSEESDESDGHGRGGSEEQR
jgi:HD-GYP domain-containing protein (c-di-GMP phosphodiesterase class II)